MTDKSISNGFDFSADNLKKNPSTGDSKKRLAVLDIAKGIAILIVVFGHCLNSFSTNPALNVSTAMHNTTDSITQFIMPIFFFMSGIFAISSAKKDLKTTLSARFTRLAVPYFTWGFLFAVFKELGGNAANMPAGIKDFLMSPLMPWSLFWFLYVMLFINIIFLVTMKIFGVKTGQPLLLIVSVIAFIIEPYVPYTWIFWLLCKFTVFFCIGSYFPEIIKNWSAKMSYPQFLFSAVLCAAVFYIFIAFGIVEDRIYTHYYQMIIAAAATYFIFALSWVIENTSEKLFELLNFFGLKTMEIYVSHSFVLGVLRVILQKIFAFEYLWARVFFMTAVTWLVMYFVWKNIPTSNRIYKFMFGIR